MANPADASGIASVLKASFAQYESLYTPEGFQATTPAPESVLQRMNEGPVWIASSEGVIVGTAAATVKKDSLYIRGMAVMPRARGKAIGLLMLEQLEVYALSLGCSRMFLSTTPFLLRAIALYEGAGFQRTAAEPHDLFGTPLFTMEKALPSVAL